ncbi:unnamed protein product [Parascedosporium putredinis]|uniref:Uncharacterized protein n=1 Tax=Parascedosporium putredinis TaxID=1442378 RepID=A0A9P1MFB2_9PEZI|nr:unnamed protein product [Parascedosporium putredinis]CAI8002080.1 unnamed protein product [Parascedosporium putredinis]
MRPHLQTGGPAGARGDQGRQGGRGGGTARRPKKEDGERQNDQDYANRKRGQPKQEAETLQERQARLARDVGVTTSYNPTTTLETLVPFLPEVATESNELGRLATAMTNMRVLAGGHVDPNPIVNPEDMYRDYKLRGSMFFTDLAAKKAIEQNVERANGKIPGPDDVIKETIINKTILGEYEPVKSAAINDVVTITKNFHLKEGTYQAKQTKAFEAKLVSLLNKANAKPKRAERRSLRPRLRR